MLKKNHYIILQNRILRMVFFLIMVFVVVSCHTDEVEIFPSMVNFDLKEPANLNPDLISEMEYFISSGKYGKVQSIMVIKDGQNIFERYYNETNSETLIPLYLATPFVASTCVGIAMDKSWLPNQDVPILNFFSEVSLVFHENEKQKIHLHHLLSQSAGIKTGMNWRDQDSAFSMILNNEMVSQPGALYVNDAGMSFLLGEIIQKSCGMRIDSFASRYLFDPLGIENWNWEYDSYQRMHTEGFYKGLWLNTHDLAKLGLLYLQKGKWGQKQVISEYWVLETLKPWMYMSSTYHQGYFCGVMNLSTTTPRLYNTSVVNIQGLSQNVWLLDDLNTVVVVTADRNASKDKLPEILTHYLLPSIFPGKTLQHNTDYTYLANALDSITLDGTFNEWEKHPVFTPQNPQRIRDSISFIDFNPKIKMGWSQYHPTKIFIAAEIIDDVCIENQAINDHLEVRLDLLNTGRTYQWIFNPNGIFYGDVANAENTLFKVQKLDGRYLFEIEIDLNEGDPVEYDLRKFFIEPGTYMGIKINCTDVDEIGELGTTLGWSTDDEQDFLFNDYSRPALFGSIIFVK